MLGKLPAPGRPTIWITVGQGPIVLAVGAGGGCLDIFTLIYPFFPLSPSLWETARYRLKYCLKGPLNPKQPTNQITLNRFLPLRKHAYTNTLSIFQPKNNGKFKMKNCVKVLISAQNIDYGDLIEPPLGFCCLYHISQ